MLSSEEFQQWNLSRRWSQTTTGVIADIRAAPPTRRVRSRSGNVSGRYPSQKMGLSLDAFTLHFKMLKRLMGKEQNR